MGRLFLAGLLTLFCATASAKPGTKEVIRRTITVSSVAFDTIAMDAARTFDPVEVEGLDFVTLYFTHVNTSATAITMSCKAGRLDTAIAYDVQVLTIAGATATSVPIVWSLAVTGNTAWPWTVNVNGYKYLQCTLTATGGVAGDTLTIIADGGTS